MNQIKTAIIPMAGLGTRFLPLSRVVPKELWPLVDRPVIQHIIQEAIDSGIVRIIFILSPGDRKILEYLKPSSSLEKILKERKRKDILEELNVFYNAFKDIKFEYAYQKKPLGDGHAILQANKLVSEEPVACLFADDIVYSKTPCLEQLKNVFKTCQKPVLSLFRVPREKISSYGIVKVEKIANRFFKVKKIIEKPRVEKAPSDLAIVGKYILTPDVFDYLKRAKASESEKGEIILAEVLDKLCEDGKLIYGYEFEGEWLECGDKSKWLKSNLFLSLKDKNYGPELKKILKNL